LIALVEAGGAETSRTPLGFLYIWHQMFVNP
jgi:hypothetical protein